jgi:TPR repeat protein
MAVPVLHCLGMRRLLLHRARLLSSLAIFLLLISTLVARPVETLPTDEDEGNEAADHEAGTEEVEAEHQETDQIRGSRVEIATAGGGKLSLFVDKAAIRGGKKGFSIVMNDGGQESEQEAEQDAESARLQNNVFEGLAEDGTSRRIGEVDPGAWKAVYELPMGDVKAKAIQGEADAMYVLGLKHLLGGVGVRRDAVLGVELIMKAAAQGHEHAQSALAFLQDHGYGVERDDARSFLNHHFAANGGSYQSKMALAYNYVRQQVGRQRL